MNTDLDCFIRWIGALAEKKYAATYRDGIRATG